jgi:hypothetical protein
MYSYFLGMFIFTTETIFKNFEVLMQDHFIIFNDLRKEYVYIKIIILKLKIIVLIVYS